MLKEFQNVDYGEVRASLVDGRVYICLVDICKILEIDSNEIRSIVSKEEEVVVNVSKNKVRKNMIFISEDALSICITKSHKANAELIFDWLFRTVIPAMVIPINFSIDVLKDDDFAMKFLNEFEDLKIQNNIMRTTIKINSPKLSCINKLLGTHKCIDIESVVHLIKFHNIQINELFRVLRATNIFDKNNEPLQEYCDKKYFRLVESKVVSLGHTIISKRVFVYPNGIKFIERLLKGYADERFIKPNE